MQTSLVSPLLIGCEEFGDVVPLDAPIYDMHTGELLCWPQKNSNAGSDSHTDDTKGNSPAIQAGTKHFLRWRIDWLHWSSLSVQIWISWIGAILDTLL